MPLTNRSLDSASGRVSLSWSMAVPTGHVWSALTDPEALPHWLGTMVSGEFVVGDTVTIEHADNYACTSRILECEPGRLLGMTWEFPGEPTSRLRIGLAPAGASTHVALQHDGLAHEAVNYLPGWHTHLLYLEALLLGRPLSMADFWSTYDALASC